jgi:hypothetical protein
MHRGVADMILKPRLKEIKPHGQNPSIQAFILISTMSRRFFHIRAPVRRLSGSSQDHFEVALVDFTKS